MAEFTASGHPLDGSATRSCGGEANVGRSNAKITGCGGCGAGVWQWRCTNWRDERTLNGLSPPDPCTGQLPVQLPPVSGTEGAGKNPESFDRNCAPSQAPDGDYANYEQLSYGQLRELCRRRGYHKKNTKAAPNTRLEAMDAATEKTKKGSSNHMDTSMTVLGKRSRTTEGSTETGTAADGKSGKRTRSAAVNIAFAVDLEVVTGHVQWGHLGLEPRMEAQQFSVVEGVDSAVSAWVAGRCNRVWGQESSPGEEKQHAELAQAAKTRELDV